MLLLVGFALSQAVLSSFAADFNTTSPSPGATTPNATPTNSNSDNASPTASTTRSLMDNGPQVQPKPSIQSILTIQQREPIAPRQ